MGIFLNLPVSLNTFALIVIILFTVKLLFLLIKPKAWIDLASKLYTNSAVIMIVSLVLSYLVLSVLVNSGVSFTEIFAVVLLIILLSMMTSAIYSKEMIALGSKMVKSKKFWKKAWFPILIWTILIVLALNEMYAFF